MPQYKKTNKKTMSRAKSLRTHTTKEENRLWYGFLSKYSPRFHRQYPAGNFILDFYCPKVKLAIELDGSQHYQEENAEYDKNRTAYLNEHGIKVLRFSNYEVNSNFNSVCEAIIREIG